MMSKGPFKVSSTGRVLLAKKMEPNMPAEISHLASGMLCRKELRVISLTRRWHGRIYLG